MNTKFITGLALLSSTAAVAQEKQPNIIMIAVDDLNDWVGVYGGHPQVKTPNIDKLAKKSVVFRNASCPGPVSGPSRSALLSGFRPTTTGVYGNDQNMLDFPIPQTHSTLPEYFTKHGYLTISTGKIFHKHSTANGSDHGQWAFDIWEDIKGGGGCGIQEDKMSSSHLAIINGKKLENPQHVFPATTNDMFYGPSKCPKENTKDYLSAKWAESQLQKSYNKPFFMSIGLSKPHLPFIVPQEFFDMYGLDTIIVPEYRMDDLDDILDKSGKKVYQPHTTFLWAKHYGVEKDVTRAYMAAVSYADACVGVILDAIEKSKYADNTIIMLWGDHGWHLGEKLKHGKATLWKESTQLPFIFHIPGMNNMQDCYRNVNLLDIYPTLIDLCNLPKKQLDGKSFAPLLKDPNLKWTPTLTSMGEGSFSVISEEWHYIISKRGSEELYNIKNDPMEWENLITKKTEEMDSVIKYFTTFIPLNPVKEIKVAGVGTKVSKGNAPDQTIKSRRILSELK